MTFTHLQVEAAVQAMMDGQPPPADIPEAILKKWSKKYSIKDWLEVSKLGKLLRTGLFHITSSACLEAILESGQILPFTSSQFKDWKLTDPMIAEDLKSVALFDFQSASPRIAASQILALSSQANHHKPAVLLQMDPAQCQPLVRWTAQIQKEHPYRQALANIEAWHAGPLAWKAVQACWTWSKQGQRLATGWYPSGGPETLVDLTHLLGEPENLVHSINSALYERR